MKYAIIAAGEGSRLQQEGVALPKPLVKLRGEAMIDRLLRIFRNNGAEEIVVIVNCLNPLTEQHLRELQAQGLAADVRLVVKTTPSSMHSFAELAPYLGDGPFCLTTVDTIFRENEFAEYIRHFQQSTLDGCMAVTDYIDDESPLYVATDESLRITGFHDTCDATASFPAASTCSAPWRCKRSTAACAKAEAACATSSAPWWRTGCTSKPGPSPKFSTLTMPQTSRRPRSF